LERIHLKKKIIEYFIIPPIFRNYIKSKYLDVDENKFFNLIDFYKYHELPNGIKYKKYEKSKNRIYEITFKSFYTIFNCNE
jgi:hypothetical protein